MEPCQRVEGPTRRYVRTRFDNLGLQLPKPWIIGGFNVLGHEARVGLSCTFIAAAGFRFERFAVDDGQLAAPIPDDATSLEYSGCRCDPNPAHTHQVGDECLSHAEGIGMCTIVSHQQPARQSLAYLMKTHTSCLRRELQEGYL